MVENYMLLEGLNDLEHIQSINHNPSSKPQQFTQSKQWSMVVIRDSLRHNELSVFPPVNHENLQISSQYNQKQRNPSSESARLSDSDVREVGPATVDRGSASWMGAWLECLRVKILSLASFFGCKGDSVRGLLCRRVIGVAAAVMVWWLCMRVRRRSSRRESIDHLKAIIKEKDEKILRLLHQISQMNEVLVARHKALASKLPN